MKWRNIYVKGDFHRSFISLEFFCHKNKTTKEDLVICLGDAGINYYLDETDDNVKMKLSKLPITLLLVHGNHEERPSNIKTVEKVYSDKFKCLIYQDKIAENIYYVEKGEFFLNNERCLAIGGAYSVDKEYRLLKNLYWFESEQLTPEEKIEMEELVEYNPNFTFVFSHTCPYNYRPIHRFLSSIDQSKVDNSMEIFLQKIYNDINLEKLQGWYCGHYHGDETLGTKMYMLFNDYRQIL